MTTSPRTLTRGDTPRPIPSERYTSLSVEDIRRCLEATGTAMRVARDRRDERLIGELRARYQDLSTALTRRAN